jgi:hypothetical protein
MYLSIQGGGQQIAYPYNYSPVPSSNEAKLYNIANLAAAAIKAKNSARIYPIGIGGVLNGVESGTPIDYAYELKQIPLSFVLRLPKGATNSYDVPANQIQGIISEAFEGFLVFARNAV